MDNSPFLLDTPHLVALAAALGWASGLRLYIVLFLTGLAGHLGWVALPEGLRPLQQPLVLGLSGTLVLIEFLADKIPFVDSLWDALHTVVRIPAGAALAAAVFGFDHATWAAVAAILGGTLAATSHAAKASTRAALNASPEPFTNIAASLAGDAMVPAALWLAWTHPIVFLVLLAIAVVFMLWIVHSLWRFVRRLWEQRARLGVAAPPSR
jgi:hypothetical protein